MILNVKYVPNIITSFRIIGTVALLFTKPMTRWFFIIYLITGFTDVIDGFIARKFGLTSDFGAKLDSVADLLFYSVMIIMMLPVLWAKLPSYIWFGAFMALFFRFGAYITSAIKFKKFASTHSCLNKLTGACVFAIPFVLLLSFSTPIFIIICSMGIISSLTEFVKYLNIKKERL